MLNRITITDYFYNLSSIVVIFLDSVIMGEPSIHEFESIREILWKIFNREDKKIKSTYKGYKVLSLAARLGNEDVLSAILKCQSDVDLRDDLGRTALHYAPNGIIARLLLENKADPNARDNEGVAAIHLAVGYNQHDKVSTLLEYKADVNLRDNKGVPPLHCSNSARMTRLLVENGAEVDMKDNEGNTPVSLAIWMGSEAILSVLAEHGADTNLPNGDGCLPLHFAASAKIARILLENGADVNAMDNASGEITTLQFAMGNWATEKIKVLIEFGVDVNHRCKDGSRPIHEADSDVIGLLVKAGADINALDGRGNTALYSAAAECEADRVVALLEYGANIHLRSKTLDETAASVGLLYDNQDISLLIFRSIMLRVAGLPVNEKTMSWETCLADKSDLPYIDKLFRRTIRMDSPSATIETVFEYSCKVEVEEMKKHRLSDTLTVYDLLCTDRIELFSQNFDLNYNVYPRYKRFMERKFRKNKLRFEARRMFASTKLPLEVVDIITSHLNMEDLRNLNLCLESATPVQSKKQRLS